MSNKYPYKDQHPICMIVCARELTQVGKRIYFLKSV